MVLSFETQPMPRWSGTGIWNIQWKSERTELVESYRTLLPLQLPNSRAQEDGARLFSYMQRDASQSGKTGANEHKLVHTGNSK